MLSNAISHLLLCRGIICIEKQFYEKKVLSLEKKKNTITTNKAKKTLHIYVKLNHA